VKADKYFKDKSNEEILDKLLKESTLSSSDKEKFSTFLSSTDLNGEGEVMSYESDGDIHLNYKMLKAMFLDEHGNAKNIELFKVFVMHELTHMEFATSNNPLYKAAHKIPFLEEFLVSFSDLYVWQQSNKKGMLPSYSDIVNFIFSSAQVLSLAARISTDEATKLATEMSYRIIEDLSIKSLKSVNKERSGVLSTDMQKPLSLFISNSKTGEASKYAQTFGVKESEYEAAVVEHIESSAGYSHKMSVNVTFGNLVYGVYVRNVEGRCFIGLKLEKGEVKNDDDASKNFAAATQFFANDLNTNAVLREELNKSTNIGINPRGVAMMDFIGFPSGATTQESTQKLYQSGNTASGLVGVYSVQDLYIDTSESITSIQQDIKAVELYKLNEPEKFYEIDAKISNLNTIRKALEVKKKDGATTIILTTRDIEIVDLSTEAAKEKLKKVVELVHSMKLAVTIQMDISNAKEEIFRTYLELGFDGISIDAKERDIKDVDFIKRALNDLTSVSKQNSISAKNTIYLKNESVRKALGDLSFSNILTITNIDEKTRQASIDEQQVLNSVKVGYERGSRVLEQNVRVEAKNIRALSDILNKNHTDITANEIRQIVKNAELIPVLQKHIESLLKGLGNNVTGENDKVSQAIGFIRGLVESYTIGMYLDAFDMSFEEFTENDLVDKEALGSLLSALFIIDTNNMFFKDTTALTMFFKQSESSFSESAAADETLSNLRKQMISFTNSIAESIEREESIANLALTNEKPSQNLSMSLAILNDSINKVSLRRTLEQTGKKAKVPAIAVKNILGAA
jgi:hypothetical protein